MNEDAFGFAVLELLGPHILAQTKLSHYDVAKMFWSAAIEHLHRNGGPQKIPLEEKHQWAERHDLHFSTDTDLETAFDDAASLHSIPQPLSDSWRCFHCDEVFSDRDSALLHFGARPMQDPSCTLHATHLRDIEAQLELYREEDTDLHRKLRKVHSDAQTALQRAEEAGYSRGLKDAPVQSLPGIEEIPK